VSARLRRAVIRKAAVCVLAAALPVFLAGCLSGKMRRELAAEYFNLGNAFFELKNYDRAMALYQRALSYSDSLPENSYNLARVYISQENYEEAFKVLVGLLAVDPENLILLQTLAYAQAKSGSTGDAIVTYRRILSFSGGNIITLYNLSVLYEAEENREEAYRYLKTAYDISPEDADVLGRLGRLEAQYGDPLTAISYLQSYMEKKADDVDTALFLCGLYKNQGLYAEALKLIETVLPRAASQPLVLFEQAYLLLTKAEERVKGLEALTKALEAGFVDKDKAGSLLLEASAAALRDIQNLLTTKGVLSTAEVEEILSRALEG
jgi:tetratricopeptide (TPR) repeat protein